jgi:biopolymer transport protein TolQ
MPSPLLPAAGNGHNGDYLMLVRQASPVVQAVLLLLLLFSVVSWAVILFKALEYGRARKTSLQFQEVFRKGRSLVDIHKAAAALSGCPLAEIFRHGYREISLQHGPERADKLDLDSLQRALLRGSNAEITRLERLNGFLATTATVTPFIGLFGTVWGIMSSFQAIGVQMNANLTTVAPGIAEALIATALGLFAAIPAVIFYNLLLNKLKVLIALMEDFSLEFLNASQKIR